MIDNLDTANQADDSTLYLGNSEAKARRTQGLEARVDGLEAKVDRVTSEIRSMGTCFNDLSEMLRNTLAVGMPPSASAPAPSCLPPMQTVSPVAAATLKVGAELLASAHYASNST